MDKKIIYFIVGLILFFTITISSVSIVVLAGNAEPEETEDAVPTYVVIEDEEEEIVEDEEEIVDEEEVPEEDAVIEEEDVIQEEVEETTEDAEETQEENDDAIEIEPVDEEPPVYGKEGDPLVAYYKLSSEEQELYIQLYEAICNHEESYVFEEQIEMDTVGLVLDCIHIDHPELYWDTVGSSCWTDQVTGLVTKLDFLYELTLDEVKEYDAILKAEADDIIYGISTKASDYEKVQYVYEQLVFRTDYVTGSPHNQTIFSMFVNHKSVCAGYAKAMQYILHQMGISCAYVYGYGGEPGDEESHAWNIVEIDGNYYYVDVTWGDPVGMNDPDYITYDYLCRDETFMSKAHRMEMDIQFPECTDDSLNYYAQNGMEYDDYSLEAIRPALSKLSDKDVIMPFFFTNEEDYREMYDDLASGKVTEVMGEVLGLDSARLQYWYYDSYRLDVQRIE